MLDGTYDVETSAGTTTAFIRTEDGKTIVNIDAPVVGKQEAEIQVDGDKFFGEGAFDVFLIGEVAYKISGEVVGDDLTISIQSSLANLDLKGKRVQ